MPSLTQIVMKMTKNHEKAKAMDELLLTELVKKLIESESQPGGPYLLNSKLDLTLNIRILKLFKIFNKALPNVESYLDAQLNDTSTHITAKLKILIDEIAAFEKKPIINHSIAEESEYQFFTLFLNTLTQEIREPAETIGRKIIHIDNSGEITKLPRLFSESLSFLGKSINLNFEILGRANFMIWVAYSIYDSVIDGDTSPGSIPTANIFMRQALELYRQCPIDYNIVLEYISKVDSSNSWEVAHCRFINNSKTLEIFDIPSKGNMLSLLQNRAIAHVIGPLCIIFEYGLENAESNRAKQALNFYCIARQLNDDLHDWVDDFTNGRMTYVLVELFRKAYIRPGKYDTELTLKKLKKIFYQTELERLCALIELYINKSVSLLEENHIGSGNSDFVNNFIKPIGLSATSALEQHRLNKASISLLNI